MNRSRRYMITSGGLPIMTRLSRAEAYELVRDTKYCIKGLYVARMPEVWG